MNELPVVLGLMICEQAVVDTRTRNVSFTNRFTTYRVDYFPSTPRRFTVFTALTNGFGEYRVRLDIESLNTGDLLYRFQDTLLFSDRLYEVPVLVNVANLVFPTEGAYQLSLFVDDEPLSRFRFQALSRFRSSS